MIGTEEQVDVARALIDARLDAVDRALLGRVSRAERLDVVGEVEARIDELLRRRVEPGSAPTREDVLAVLTSIDPPEAYLDGVDVPPVGKAGPHAGRPPDARAPSTLEHRSWLSGMSGIGGALAVGLLPAEFLLIRAVSDSQGMVFLLVGLWVLTGLAAVASGVAAVALAFAGRFQNGWAVAGPILGVGSMGAGALAVLFMLSEFI